LNNIKLYSFCHTILNIYPLLLSKSCGKARADFREGTEMINEKEEGLITKIIFHSLHSGFTSLKFPA
jgi:hypothetical protein